MKIIVLLAGLAATIWLASHTTPDTMPNSERGKVVLISTQGSLLPDGQFLFASLVYSGHLQDSVDVEDAEVCQLRNGNPTGTRFKMVGRKFPDWFRFADDCDEEGDIAIYRIVGGGPNRMAVVTGFERSE